MKTIHVEDEIWQKLTIKKAEYMLGSLNDVIEKLLKESRPEKK
jgi:predicted CopG family antitoxin